VRNVGTSGAFEVDEIPSDRWELALDLLRRADHMFLLPGEVPVGLQRYEGWPGADGHVHVSIFTGVEPKGVTQEMAQRDVAIGIATVRRAETADARLTELFEEYGVVYSYVYDYGHGAVKIGEADADGSVRLV
jgi:hypothetical protein